MPAPFVILLEIGERLSTKELRRELNPLVGQIENVGVVAIAQALHLMKMSLINNYNSVKSFETKSKSSVVATMVAATNLEENALYESVYTLVISGYMAGVQNSSQSVPYTLALDIDWQLIDQDAVQYAQQYTYDLIKQVSRTTKKGIGRAVEAYIKSGGTVEDLANDIRPLIANEPSTVIIENLFGADRAEMIAVTEATRVYAEGKINGYMVLGLADYPPEIKPPLHVRCRCDVRPDFDDNGDVYWVWLTSNDTYVCPICEPYHKKRVGLAKKAEVES